MSEVITRNASENEVAASRPNVVYTPRFDVAEEEQAFVLRGDLPGVTPEGLEISIENQVLTIWGRVAPRHQDAKYWLQEYGVGDFYRTFTLSDVIDGQAISAQLKDGVLTLRLPKKEEARPRRIEVQVG